MAYEKFSGAYSMFCSQSAFVAWGFQIQQCHSMVLSLNLGNCLSVNNKLVVFCFFGMSLDFCYAVEELKGQSRDQNL